MRTPTRTLLFLATSLAVSVTVGCGAPDGGDLSFGDGSEPADDSGGEDTVLGGKADWYSDLLEERRRVAEQFQEPTLTDAEQEEALERYAYVDADEEVPSTLLDKTLLYYDTNLSLLTNPDYVTVVDYRVHSSQHRFYLVDMTSGEVETHVVAHGSGSDPENDGIPSRFSNIPNSNMTSLGFYLTAETYYGKYDLSLRLDGLSETNSNVRVRNIVMHGASYVSDGRDKQGRSWGCLALPMSEKNAVIAKVKEGSLIYVEGTPEDDE